MAKTKAEATAFVEHAMEAMADHSEGADDGE